MPLRFSSGCKACSLGERVRRRSDLQQARDVANEEESFRKRVHVIGGDSKLRESVHCLRKAVVHMRITFTQYIRNSHLGTVSSGYLRLSSDF